MRTILSKTTRFSLLLMIPAMFIMSCQEDIAEPNQAHPKITKIPQKNK